MRNKNHWSNLVIVWCILFFCILIFVFTAIDTDTADNTKVEIKEVPKTVIHIEQEPEEPEDCIVYDALPLSADLQLFTYEMCVECGIVDYYELILAMMWQESNFNPSAISSTNDYGIMQINTVNHNWLRQRFGITDFLDAKQNIVAGVHMISSYLLKYGNESKALMAYNLGEGGAAAMWRNGIYTTDYSARILEKKEKVLNNLYI